MPAERVSMRCVREILRLLATAEPSVNPNRLDYGVGRYRGIRYARRPAYEGGERTGREKRKRRTTGQWSVSLSA